MTRHYKPLRVLYVAYSLTTASETSCGGAEQMLITLERAMQRRGHETVVAACRGSQAAGTIFSTGDAATAVDAFADRDAEHIARTLDFIGGERLAGRGFDLVHDEGGSFWRYAAEIDEPVLLSAHLPRDFYGPELARTAAPNLFVNCVSDSQRRTFRDVPSVTATIPNGIELSPFEPVREQRDGFLLWLGRICEEKGAHCAIAAAALAGMPLVLAGDVYPFSDHERYFERALAPNLDGTRVRFVRRPSVQVKLELLRACRAVLVPSLVDETSSLVAMEAAACGTPVIAFARGALLEVVRDGVTGFLVRSVEEMALAVARAGTISAPACRNYATKHFSADRMADQYEELYREIVVGEEALAA